MTAAEARASRLREESAMLAEARAALRGGAPGQALERLDSAARRFPDGVLGQEREALVIEALSRTGQRAAAAQRADAFLRAYPGSAFADRVATFLR
jgi:outer membrane protein assembly factor BamD (BamD/ComL family)